MVDSGLKAVNTQMGVIQDRNLQTNVLYNSDIAFPLHVSQMKKGEESNGKTGPTVLRGQKGSRDKRGGPQRHNITNIRLITKQNMTLEHLV